MIEEIRYVLQNNQSPERTRLLIGALELLEEYGFHSYEFEIKTLMSTENVIGSDDMVMSIGNIIHRSLDIVLRQLGLINVEGSTSIKVDILDGLKTLETYDDHETVIAIIDEEEDPTLALSSILELVTTRSWGEFAEVLGLVPTSVIERIESIHNRLQEVIEGEDSLMSEASEEELKMQNLIIKRVKEFVAKKPPSTDTLIEVLLNDGHRLGLDFDHYLSQPIVSQSLENYHQGKKPVDAARNILSLALASPLSINEIKKEINKRLDDIYADIDFITSIDIALGDEMKKVIAYE